MNENVKTISAMTIETVIDDLVWDSNCNDVAFRKKMLVCFNRNDIPWYYIFNLNSDHQRICDYAMLKAKEHKGKVKKMQNIQLCIRDVSLRPRLEPLIAHHQWISISYMIIYTFFYLDSKHILNSEALIIGLTSSNARSSCNL